VFDHADEFGSQRRQQLELELKEHPKFCKFFQENVFKVKWMGCVNHKKKEYVNEKEMERTYQLVANWRDEFIEEIFNSDKRVDLSSTNIYLNRKKECLEKLSTILKTAKNITSLLSKNDITGHEQQSMFSFTKDLNFILQHDFYLTKIEDKTDEVLEELKLTPKQLKDQVGELHVFINSIKKSNEISGEKKEKILGQWY